MNFDLIQRLAHRLQAGGLAACEFDAADGSSLRLRLDVTTQHGCAPDGREAPGVECVASAAEQPAAHALTAPRFGHFLHRHPLSNLGQVAVDRKVKMGDIVGFVQAGDIVVPVTATQGGTVRGVPVADGDLVGYGEVLAWLD